MLAGPKFDLLLLEMDRFPRKFRNRMNCLVWGKTMFAGKWVLFCVFCIEMLRGNSESNIVSVLMVGTHLFIVHSYHSFDLKRFLNRFRQVRIFGNPVI